MADVGVMTHSRPRPTYKVAVPEEWQREEYFPMPNRTKLELCGATLAWRLKPWLSVEGFLGGVRYRQIEAAAFDEGGLACFVQVQQFRNSLNREVGVQAFAACLDDHSSQLGEAGGAIAEALEVFSCRDWVEPGETFAEVCTLFVPATHKGKLVWAEAITRLLFFLTRRHAGDVMRMMSVLKVGPLEEWWRVRRLQDDRWERCDHSDTPLEIPEREISLGARRRRAMKRLYEERLHFETLPGMSDWMARFVHD